MTPIQAIVTDIEGTTSSLDFVKQTLFPYAREHLPAFLREHADNPEVQHWMARAAEQADVDAADQDTIAATLRRWIDEDRKATPLKALQGMVWRHGYQSGAFRAHLYPEVADRLRAWRDQGYRLYVYSSGSVAAQRMFFRHSQAGDLEPLFDGFFDTETGAKQETASYREIAASLGCPSMEILFLSDIDAELDAAREAGMQTTLLCRPPDDCVAGSAHPCVNNFEQIDLPSRSTGA